MVAGHHFGIVFMEIPGSFSFSPACSIFASPLIVGCLQRRNCNNFPMTQPVCLPVAPPFAEPLDLLDLLVWVLISV